MRQLTAMDSFIQRTITSFVDAQVKAYQATMSDDDPNIAQNQATYEVCILAMAAIAKYVAQVEEMELLPAPLAMALEVLHGAICDTGDEHLRKLGYKPEEF